MHWSEEKKQEVLEGFALSGNHRQVSRDSGVPLTTVRRWVRENPGEIERIRERNKEIAERAIESSLEERMGEIAGFGKELREKARALLDTYFIRVTPGGIASLARAGVDIELRGLGEPTESIELRGKMLDAAIERELAKLAAAGQEGISDADSQGEKGH